LDVSRNLSFCLEFGGLMAQGWHNSTITRERRPDP
jgi:hypothetical protein